MSDESGDTDARKREKEEGRDRAAGDEPSGDRARKKPTEEGVLEGVPASEVTRPTG